MGQPHMNKSVHALLLFLGTTFTFLAGWQQLVWANSKEAKAQYQIMPEEKMVELMAKESGLTKEVIKKSIQGAIFIEKIVPKAVSGGYEAKGYNTYRPLFVNKKMADAGRSFIEDNYKTLQAAENKFKVDKEIIAAILGIESKFGKHVGNVTVRDALYTLALAHPKRAKFFRKELANLIKIAQSNHIAIEEMKGSYAGAFGAGQFMPSSFLAYAVDGDNDGKIDMYDDMEDIVQSVANYFAKHKWQFHAPIAEWVNANVELPKEWQEHVKSEKLRKWTTLKTLREQSKNGKLLGVGWDENLEVSVIKLRKIKTPLLITRNFYSIMRYNPSFNYAMAVAENVMQWKGKEVAGMFEVAQLDDPRKN